MSGFNFKGIIWQQKIVLFIQGLNNLSDLYIEPFVKVILSTVETKNNF